MSNYMICHLEEPASDAGILPAVNQIEVSPFLQQHEVRAWCAAHGIVVQASSSLTKAGRL